MHLRPIEPGLLRVFRYFTMIGVAYFAANYLFTSAESQGKITTWQASVQLGLIAYSVLLAYLSLPDLERALKVIYLPIALTISTVVPVLSMVVFHPTLSATTLVPMEMGLWSVFPVLFIPLVIIAWQYNFRAVLAFTVAVTLADLILNFTAVQQITLDTVPVISSVFIRAFTFGMVGHIVTQLMETQREQRDDLIHANLRLSRYAATLENLAVSQERNRLARELHDTLAHTLSGLAVNLEALKLTTPSELVDVHHMLNRSLENTRIGLSETRRALKNLRSSFLEDMGLVNAIRNYALDITARADVKLGLDLPARPLDLTPALEQCIYRITQESLTNCLRHADAHCIRIRLEQERGIVSLVVEDDGKGFVANAVDSSDRFGLRGMQERARLAGGELEVLSSPQHGTRIRFHVKLPDD
ncbi:MAG: sensor histidine kinase [Bellilinea sp.]